ncbi:MAG: N-acetylmuramoyl-L-alanine amidase [Clostridia bacterium]|nr:N-acetylmuramoyl-L-alanine amidase [Clostridia bacterium]
MIILGKKTVALVLVFVILAQICLLITVSYGAFPTEQILKNFVIVIDAGHGGVDGGVVGVKTKVKESDLNLVYAQCLGSMFARVGAEVVYTRKTQDGLYGLATKGFKRRDMEKRKAIIQSAKPTIVLSVHMNKFALAKRQGPQVFFQKGDEESAKLASIIQKFLNNFTQNSHSHLSGDFFICRCIDAPSIIVEFGFLSNPEEEEKLQEEQYMFDLCNQTFYGVMTYLYST